MTDKSAREAVNDLSEQVSRLVRDELRLALDETRTKARRAGMSGGLLAAAGILALYGGAALVAGLVLALARRLPPWLAALVAGGGLTVVAAVLGACGALGLRNITPVPEEALAQAEETAETVRRSTRPE
ncbi:phage holin family protein [Qaidamihabitans albus]|uniref:phage holin family protein n=1 Tax=Qaidamihabitans albus TaxID=2795733 RepID=UPI0018F1B84B|nr:phage holin family protein [Qaidamihabitans albus]